MPYWQAAHRGELLYQRCRACGVIPMRPADVCGACQARAMEWQTSNGLGSIYSWTVVWRPQMPAFRVPYVPAIISMDEGWWLMSSVIGCAVEDLVADIRVRVEFHPVSDEVSLPYVRPIESPGPKESP